MNTIDLINRLSVKHNITTGRAEMILSILVERIVEKVKKDGEITITNFGKFTIKRKQPDVTRNVITFDPDRVFLETINSQ